MEKKQLNSTPEERQKWESSQAYEAFVTYRDMGAERSVRAVARELGKSETLISRWSSKNQWVERVRDWENEINRQAKEKASKDCSKMLDRHIGIAMKMQKKALDALEAMDPGDLSARDIKEYFRVATEIERESRIVKSEISKEEETTYDDALSLSLKELAEGIKSDD